ncbi:MAG: hypothetical protein AB8H79_06035 [Myxococcota bacterium]
MKAQWLGVCLALGGCAQGVVCGENTTRVDGVCVGEAPIRYEEPVVTNIVDLLFEPGDCEPLPPGEGLDLIGLCAGGVCLHDTVAQAIEAGGAPSCEASGSQLLSCEWSGMWAILKDDDLDGEPDPDGRIERLQLDASFVGPDADGLGIGVDISCFLATLPPPDRMGLMRDGDSVLPAELFWDAKQVHVGTSGPFGRFYAPSHRVTFINLGSLF